MPLISQVGARSIRVRAIYALIFAVLTLGAATMVYPLMLMLSGSVKSEADNRRPTVLPHFWFDDLALFQKYVESKYDVNIAQVEASWDREVGAWFRIERPKDVDAALLADYLEWRGNCPWYKVGNARGGKMLPINGRLFRQEMYDRYQGDIDAFGRDMDLSLKTWVALLPPNIATSRFSGHESPIRKAWLQFANKRPLSDRVIDNVDGNFWRNFLLPTYGGINAYNAAHGTTYESYRQVFLEEQAPPATLGNGQARKDWQTYVRNQLAMAFIHLQPRLAGDFHKYLAGVYADLSQLNARYHAHFNSFEGVPFTTTCPTDVDRRVDWAGFLRDAGRCPAEAISIFGPRQSFEAFVATRRNVSASAISPLRMPIAQADWHDAMAHHGALRWEFTTRNYKQVFEYVGLHGNGLLNTLIYCILAIGTQLVVNPLAAYALSRYRPPSTYTVLLFCMATMAFPGEVTMIPRFLLLRSFPMGALLAGGAGFMAAMWAVSAWRPTWPLLIRATLALGAGFLCGGYILPLVAGDTSVSLLNTFAALVLPGMANGFAIFLLKGFFDSLPRELYEAADIDGASGWSKFWMITMSLSKPILAVVALDAFTGAYGAFMQALIIVPDSKMWTLMVWLYQLQSEAHPTVRYASLVIAAAPTFLVFALCQNIIMRGIVVPVEK